MMIITLLVVKYSVINKLKIVSCVIFDFLSYINHKNKEAPKLKNGYTNNKIGQLLKVINQATLKIAQNLEKYTLTIQEVTMSAKK